MNNSILKGNKAILGGAAIFLRNTNGYVELKSNFFEENSLNISTVSGGGAIACTLSAASKVVLINNTFFNNNAYLGSFLNRRDVTLNSGGLRHIFWADYRLRVKIPQKLGPRKCIQFLSVYGSCIHKQRNFHRQLG